jgi:hypothetical protein
MSTPVFNLDGLKMNAPVTAPGGVINADTIFRFTQIGSHVEAHYAGGLVVSGRLIGLLKGDTLEFRYCQLHNDQSLAGGHSNCTLNRDNGESGENIIAQLD